MTRSFPPKSPLSTSLVILWSSRKQSDRSVRDPSLCRYQWSRRNPSQPDERTAVPVWLKKKTKPREGASPSTVSYIELPAWGSPDLSPLLMSGTLKCGRRFHGFDDLDVADKHELQTEIWRRGEQAPYGRGRQERHLTVAKVRADQKRGINITDCRLKPGLKLRRKEKATARHGDCRHATV
ncbi:hypothetical protein RRG08_021583 [Elysia crispata]|uniref:Uncharacterized protein n=1 Tax=Elysia crispata TaxID=231223 RepID=A0AAE1CEH0_9GAST|nr:hypothetical protein RRG08_021583 [Elysia crispata]